MRAEIKYIELKTGYAHSGPAWIGLVHFSKSGRTIYFNGKAFQKIGSDRMRGNFYDIESGEEYWISGVKKDQTDRHQFGSGQIQIEERIIESYLAIINRKSLDKSKFSVCKVDENLPITRINEMENTKYEESEDEIDHNRRFQSPHELSEPELDYFIDYFHESSIAGGYLKGRKMARNKMNELLAEKEKRAVKNPV
ncbi:MAG: hypothetical protein ACO1N0_03940 [Fluviicola sp.]